MPMSASNIEADAVVSVGAARALAGTGTGAEGVAGVAGTVRRGCDAGGSITARPNMSESDPFFSSSLLTLLPFTSLSVLLLPLLLLLLLLLVVLLGVADGDGMT